MSEEFSTVRVKQSTRRKVRLLAAYRNERIWETIGREIDEALREWEATAPKAGRRAQRDR